MVAYWVDLRVDLMADCLADTLVVAKVVRMGALQADYWAGLRVDG